MRLVPLESYPEVQWCTDCFFIGRETRAVVATAVDVEGREPLIGGLCGHHAEVMHQFLSQDEEPPSE